MAGRFLLDTNIIIALFANDEGVTAPLERADDLLVPSVVLGELYYGARKSERSRENVARIDDFAGSNAVLTCDAEVARHYGEIKADLRQKGQPIPDNDLWIAAIALRHGLTLVSRDVHFRHVERLDTCVW